MTGFTWATGAAAVVAVGLGMRWRPWRVGPAWLPIVAGLSFVFNGAIAWHRGVPVPRVQDEFSYLLAADTFAHGRLANPTPPAWPALQTFHELMVPAYASKYPPGQGAVLAAGQVATGLPIVGVWAATAALVWAVGWAVAGLVGRGWGVAAAVLVAVHPQVAEWAQTYWGGTVAAVGGALVLGGWARIAIGQAGCEVRRTAGSDGKRPGRSAQLTTGLVRRAGVAIGVGLGVLLVSRPYEGLALAVPLVLHLIWTRRVTWWMAVGLVPLVAFAGTYNAAVTGRPWRLPYLVYENQYAAAPPLLVEPPRAVPAGLPAEMAAYAERVELPHFLAQRSAAGFVRSAGEKLAYLAWAISPWTWPVVLLGGWAAWRDRRARWVAAAIGAVVVATLLSNWTRSQYVAPATAAAVAVLAMGAARWPAVGRPAWAGMAAGLLMTTLAPRPTEPPSQRATLAAALGAKAGGQLVIVRYAADHRPDDEWVYNDADPAAAKVVWARAGVLPESAVRAAYPNRTVWHVGVSAAAAAVQRAP